ncbi:Rhodanese-like domain-containing protein [Vararia minispora EC-137]|uniref:Rhodanese-like domain-containing protein n=1 Tax=Vararia minispora EC-137 TaxID=1314806 RepID=A0ACB8QNY9_9AGAM|nr:Rhodanese-like domain-containing protein [Vararia minispora EC-137]
MDGTKIAVTLTLAKTNDAEFLYIVGAHLQRMLALKAHLISVATTGVGETSLLVCGSSTEQVQRAALLASAKFLGHIKPLSAFNTSGTIWIASVRDVGWTPYDEAALWDVINKSAQDLVDPVQPPPGSRSIAQILAEARTRLQRLTPQQAYEELHDPNISMPVLLVDIRPAAQREAHGGIRGSLVIERNVLEWRFDPRCIEGRLEIATRYDLRVIIICQEGYTSSLAAASLQGIGLLNATDVEGGFVAWKAAGLPVEMPKQTWM